MESGRGQHRGREKSVVGRKEDSERGEGEREGKRERKRENE